MRLAGLVDDLRYALRALLRTRGFTLVAVLTLALGIGVNTAVFSIVNALMFRALPVRDGNRLVVLAATGSATTALTPMSFRDLQDYRASTREVFEDVAGYSVGFIGLAPPGGRPARVLATWVTGNYFPLLDIQPALGRFIRDEEGGPGRADAVVVLGYPTWQRRFGADRSVVGRRAMLNGRPCTIVGVAPETFTGTFAFSDPELYLPVNWSASFPHEDRRARMMHTLARLRPDTSVERAQAAASVVAARLARDHPDTNTGVGVSVLPERLARPEENNASSNRFAAAVILGLVGLVLIVAEVNVTSILLARSAARRLELAVRAALGASRARLMQHLLAEVALLAFAGGVAGVGLAVAITQLLTRVRLPGDLPVRFDFHLDHHVMLYAALLTGATAVLVGMTAARRASRADIDRTLRGASGPGSAAGHRLRRTLVVGQVAVTFVLSLAGGLFARSLGAAENVDLGFTPERVLNVQMDVDQVGYQEPRGRRFFDDVERRVRELPGVDDAAFAFSAPLGYVRVSRSLHAQGRPARGGEEPSAGKNIVGPRYFSTMGVRVERGRGFTTSDDERARPVAIVNRRLADVLWPGQDPLGRRFSEQGPGGPWMEVVGVTATGKYRQLFEDPQPYFYVPIAQQYVALRVLHVRTQLDPEALAPAVERAIRSIEPELPLYDVQGMTKALDGGYGRFLVRVAALFAAILAGLALTLTVVGLYGVVSYLTSERTHEIGVRVALGARPSDVARLVAREAVVLTVAGTAIGVLAAFAAGQLVRGLLFGIAPTDGAAYALAFAALLMVTLAAVWAPARRALALDTAATLRAQ